MGKSTRKITNWSHSNKALINRGSLTFWIDKHAIKSWSCTEHHGRRGRGFIYSDVAIETALVIKGVFNLSLRALEGFTHSVFQLANVPLTCPSYSCISKRAKTVNINYRAPSRGSISHVVIDSTGLKVYGEGEWKVRKHGKEKRRTWRKLHLAVDANTHEVVAAALSGVGVADNEVLLNPLRRSIEQVSADGTYDTKACHSLLQRKGCKGCKGCKASIPPRSNAGFWEDNHPRNEAVTALKEGELAQCKEDNDYHLRSLSETAIYRYKQLVSPKLSLRDYHAQVGEALAGVKAMNKVIKLGMTVREQAA